MSDNKNKGLNPKFKSSMKSSKKTCPFVRPARIMKEGRMIDTKCCTAYIPGFEVTDDRLICEACLVPDLSVRPDRCRYFAPLALPDDSPTKWQCRLLGDKNIEPEQCTPEHCERFEPIEPLKWEIGRPVDKSKKPAPVTDPDSDSKKPAPPVRKKLIPKSEQMKKNQSARKKDEFSGGGYW